MKLKIYTSRRFMKRTNGFKSFDISLWSHLHIHHFVHAEHWFYVIFLLSCSKMKRTEKQCYTLKVTHLMSSVCMMFYVNKTANTYHLIWNVITRNNFFFCSHLSVQSDSWSSFSRIIFSKLIWKFLQPFMFIILVNNNFNLFLTINGLHFYISDLLNGLSSSQLQIAHILFFQLIMVS